MTKRSTNRRVERDRFPLIAITQINFPSRERVICRSERERAARGIEGKSRTLESPRRRITVNSIKAQKLLSLSRSANLNPAFIGLQTAIFHSRRQHAKVQKNIKISAGLSGALNGKFSACPLQIGLHDGPGHAGPD